MQDRLLIIGAGFSGAVLARELAEAGDFEIDVVDARDHLAGNCHTERDPSTGIMLHRYGPHVFHTRSQRVWDYVNRHGRFRPYVSRIKACTSQGVFPLPINLQTINQFFGQVFSPAEARAHLQSLAIHGDGPPQNFEEVALSLLGRELYQTFILGYTLKQWGCAPSELPSSIFRRLPLRFDYDDNYHDATHQGIPEEGYTSVIQSLLSHPRISVELRREMPPGELLAARQHYRHVFYTGPIDAFFEHSLGHLSYRTVTFERIDCMGDHQGCAIMNYPGLEVPYTRVHEHKHFMPWETHDRTVAFREYSHETGPADVPYYPKRLQRDKEMMGRYRGLAEAVDQVSFLGRLATYRYLDMDRVVEEALDFAEAFMSSQRTGRRAPTFPETCA
ncbi:MAG TPA: UDP-galactopyranose mutase [Verrucomicrobium sp.]|nr:UDP-galactopyranose mutase [Verrucomicrobium sp.]